MSLSRLFSAADISASGMSAERLRMEVVAENLANANTTRGPNGEAYRRKQVVFRTLLESEGDGAGGVEVVGVMPEGGELPQIHLPSHPDADEFGFVTLPNVKPTMEMVDMITAARSYEANLRALRTFKDMAEQALGLLRGA
ncbi:MAG: flagellar basal body rod protein FlgC [Planctomycetales bacterium]|nr:flagellar basal body rod protein FlgC [Planctomycetales bacterium]